MSQQQPQDLSEFDVRAAQPADREAWGGPGASGQSRFVGWVLFAGTIMILTGIFEAVLGLTAEFFNGYFEATKDPLVVNDYDSWGWMHTILGSLAVVAGVGLFSGKLWARVLGILFAFCMAIVNLGFLSVAPIWSVTVIVLSVICIFAITVHGAELRDW